MNYLTCIVTHPEGFGSVFQYVLTCYFMCKVYNMQFVYTRIKNFEHMSWDGYSSQEEWDELWNNYITNVCLPNDEIMMLEDVPAHINKAHNSYHFTSRTNTLFVFDDRIMTKNFLDKTINAQPEIMSNLSKNYFANNTVESYYDKNKINIALHVRRYTKTDCCNAESRELFIKGNKFDIYYYNMISTLKSLIGNTPKEFHIFTQIDDAEIGMFDNYFELEDDHSKIIIHKGNNTISDLHHMIVADIFIMAKSSLSVVVNYYSNGISIIRGTFQHTTKNTTLNNDIDGSLTEVQKNIILDKLNQRY